MESLKSALKISSFGMRAQSERLRIVAENIANSDSIATNPGEKPYQRKTIHFENVLDKELGIDLVKVSKIDNDKSPFPLEYNPGHPAANEAGYILKPNVNVIIESADQKEALRSYEANLNSIKLTKTMLERALSLLN